MSEDEKSKHDWAQVTLFKHIAAMDRKPKVQKTSHQTDGNNDEPSSSTKGCESIPLPSAVVPEWPRSVLLLRDGESVANATDVDVLDCYLTEKGQKQAMAWRDHIGTLGAEVVLVSPLRRAVQTACFAFANQDIPMELCRPAREFKWSEKQNTLGTPVQMQELLRQLPRGRDVQHVEEALALGPDEPSLERDSIAQLEEILKMREENVVAVACHWGVIKRLCGASADNCEIIQCEWSQSGQLNVVKHHRTPGGASMIHGP